MKWNNLMKKAWITLLACLLLSACTMYQQQDNAQTRNRNPLQDLTRNGTRNMTASIQANNRTIHSNVPVVQQNGKAWVPLSTLASAMDFRYQWNRNDGTMEMGYTDVLYGVKCNSRQAVAEGKKLTLPDAPKQINGKPYITTESLSTLWGFPVTWNKGQIQLQPKDEAKQPLAGGVQLQATTLQDIDIYSMLQYSTRFLGVPYKFGAKPSEAPRRFDCSSFVQYVYKQFGVKLPRSSRSQAKVGQYVSFNQLQPGDLMFFYTPGRFKSNRIVGHVGIYRGNNKFIHTYGKPGVTISVIKPGSYWHGRFLHGRRVAR
jgi:cell wall-associated NlpC family hydrolase